MKLFYQTMALGSCNSVCKVATLCNGAWSEVCLAWQHRLLLLLVLDTDCLCRD